MLSKLNLKASLTKRLNKIEARSEPWSTSAEIDCLVEKELSSFILYVLFER